MLKHLQLIGGFTLCVALLASCAKNDPNPVRNTFVPVNVINADSAKTVNIYLNGTRQNSSTGILGETSSGYLQIPTGEQTLAFKDLFNSDKFNSPTTLFTLPVNFKTLKDARGYSIFMAGTTSDQVIITADTLKTDKANAMVRFISAASASPALNVYMNDTLRFAVNAFKAVTKYTPVGNGKKAIKVTLPNSTVALYTNTIVFNADSVYTLYSTKPTQRLRIGLLRTQ
jgi:hypothetical protein